MGCVLCDQLVHDQEGGREEGEGERDGGTSLLLVQLFHTHCAHCIYPYTGVGAPHYRIAWCLQFRTVSCRTAVLTFTLFVCVKYKGEWHTSPALSGNDVCVL